MKLKSTIIFISFCIFSIASASEPLLAKLEAVISNETQRFALKDYTFICKPYGAVALERLYSNSSLNSECRKSIDKFYIKNPNLKHYAARILKTNQLYHIEIKNKECVLYASGEISLSELLLKNGLAIFDSTLKDEEFRYYFLKAQRVAKVEKKGLWSGKIYRDCVKELNKY